MAKTECEHFRTLHLKLVELSVAWAAADAAAAGPSFVPGPRNICHLGQNWEANLNGKQMPDMAKFKTETFAAQFQCQQKANALPTKSLNFLQEYQGNCLT